MSRHHEEFEVKLVPPAAANLLRVPALAQALGAKIEGRRLTRCDDVYLETADFWFLRAGLGLRIRIDEDGRGRLALKSAAPPVGIVHRRVELEENVREPRAALRSGRVPGRRIARWIEGVGGRLTVRPLLTLRQTRLACDVRLPGGASAVISSDAVRLTNRTRGLIFHEVEIEHVRGPKDEVVRFAQRLRRRTRWAVERRSKLERAAELAGLRPPTRDDPGAKAVDRSDRWIDAAWKVLIRQGRRFLWHEAGVRVGLDPVPLHDMRVAARRFRAALSVFRRCLPPRALAAFDRDLRTIASAIGAVRDLDVAIAAMRNEIRRAPPSVRDILSEVLGGMSASRLRARRRMLAAFALPRHRALVRRLSAFIASRPPEEAPCRRAGRSAGKVGGGVLEKRAAKVVQALEAMQPGDAEDLHRLRILLKKFRYALEFVAPIHGKTARRVIRSLAATQDRLGAHHDETVLIATLQRARESSGPRASEFDLLLARHRRRQRLLERACDRALADWKGDGMDRVLRRLRRAAD